MRSFLKWAGNKYQIIDRIRATLPPGNRLVEPFLGSGAVFLNTDFPRYLLSDNNNDLIQLYLHLQTEGNSFINFCRKLFSPENNTKQAYYELRTKFNTTRSVRLKSALFLYLNKHCYNGLCRYNAKGGFNVPFGKYKRPYFPENEMLNFHRKSQQAIFKHADFRDTMRSAKPGDVVYCDPPYVALSETANFTSYSAGGFGMQQQQELADLARILAAKGIPVVISNHRTKFTVKAYSPYAKIKNLNVQRYISCNGDNRGKASEVLAVFAA